MKVHSFVGRNQCDSVHEMYKCQAVEDEAKVIFLRILKNSKGRASTLSSVKWDSDL